ncbi:GLPGLI family protein [Polaribacter sp. IC073]|uniref:GLPGLI family protein n=1 Tax=Polaribacter sp. IC073 TaxID=2508540 RepID=UPI0011BF38E8|nr:GLPGLI family protein [Polaribacter sp. IC073]TXD47875.1 GLPGLI family protein [Polaribacter sp. IC073]
MLKKILVLTFSLIIYSTYSQKKTINVYQLEYQRKLTFEDTPTNPFISSFEYIKFIELNKSIYKKIKKNRNSNILKKDKKQNTVVDFYPTGKNISTVFKNYKKNEFYSKHEVAYKYFVVKDKLDVFDWNVLNNTKEILGYNCQLATMDYRGRKYEAWFTTDLPVGGPWKYDGLPGMILEIKSKDNFIAFKATRIKNTAIELDNLKNPFKLKKAITWTEFKALYKRKAMELINYRPDENFIGVESSRGGIELYINKDDEEYNNALKKLPKTRKN